MTLKAALRLLGVRVATSGEERLGEGRRLPSQPTFGEGEGDLSFGVLRVREDLVQSRLDDSGLHPLLPELGHQRTTAPRTEPQPIPDPAPGELGVVEPAPVFEVVQDRSDEPGREVLSPQPSRQLTPAASPVSEEAEPGFPDLPSEAGLHQSGPELGVHDRPWAKSLCQEGVRVEGQLQPVLERQPGPFPSSARDGDAGHPGGRRGRGNRMLVGISRDGGFSRLEGSVRQR